LKKDIDNEKINKTNNIFEIKKEEGIFFMFLQTTIHKEHADVIEIGIHINRSQVKGASLYQVIKEKKMWQFRRKI